MKESPFLALSCTEVRFTEYGSVSFLHTQQASFQTSSATLIPLAPKNDRLRQTYCKKSKTEYNKTRGKQKANPLAIYKPPRRRINQ